MVAEEQKLSSGSIRKRPNVVGDAQPARKRIRQTYAQRHRPPSESVPRDTTITTPPRVVRTLGAMKRGNCSPTTGQVDFSTPMLKKIREQPPTPLSNSSHNDNAIKVPQALMSDLQALRRSMPVGQFRIYEAIFTWLSGLLRSTETKQQEPHPKSLLGMCLRRVPATLAEIEAWDRKVSEAAGGSKWNLPNARQDLYEQFEGFGGSETGWRPLKTLVRADALLMLNKSVAEGLFESSFECLLAELCLHHKCSGEAASIVSNSGRKMASPRGMSSKLSESGTTLPLRAVVGGLRGKRSPGALFECLSQCLKARTLPSTWMSTSGFRNVWISSLETMTANRLVPSTIEFICTALEQLVLSLGNETGSGSDYREQTMISMVAGMAATAMMLERETTTERNMVRRRAWRRIMYALDRCSTDVRLQNQTRCGGGRFVLSLAHYLAMVEAGTDVGREEPLGRVDEEFFSLRGVVGHGQYRETLVLICSIAQFRGRACGVPCHDILFEICDALDKLKLPEWYHAGLRTDGAFILAQKTKDLRDLAFAEKLPTVAARTDQSRTVFSGWRWEEGISEWVLPSPARKASGGRGRGEAGGKAGRYKRERTARSPATKRRDSHGEDDSNNSDNDIDKDSNVKATNRDNDGDSNKGRSQLSSSGSWKPSRWCQRNNAGKGLVVKELGAGEMNVRASQVKAPNRRKQEPADKGTQGTNGRLRDVKALLQIRKHGRLIGDDDWDELF